MEQRYKTGITILMALFIFSYLASVLFDDDMVGGDTAVVKIRGVLTVDRGRGFSTDFSSSTDIVEIIKTLERDQSIKAVIYDINSPGGSAVASDEIATAIKNSEKVNIAVIREVGASGGYWIASACNVIFANRMSITGSIGATASYLDFSGLINRYNVSYERLVSGEYKDMGTPFRELTNEEREMFDETLNSIEEFFVSEISQNRNLPKGKVEQLADGRIYLGIDAKENGLIDYLGGFDDAKEYLRNEYNLTAQTVVYESERSVFSDIFTKIELPFNNFGLKV